MIVNLLRVIILFLLIKHVSNDETRADGGLPFLVSVQKLGRHVCSGTIIAPFWILTAGNCLTSEYNNDTDLNRVTKAMTTVRGMLKLDKYMEEERRQCRRLYQHEDYFHNNIGLINLESPYHKSYVVELSKAMTFEAPCTVYGWHNAKALYYERERFFNVAEPSVRHLTSNELSNATGILISGEKCDFTALQQIHLCVCEDPSQVFPGDYGAPLMCNGLQAGVYSRKGLYINMYFNDIACNNSEIYMRVDQNWVHQTTLSGANYNIKNYCHIQVIATLIACVLLYFFDM